MLLNAFVALCGARVRLVPYQRAHVPRYHTWMQDAELLALTASERLSLDEEFANQQSWLRDADKLTFIVCVRGADECAPADDRTGDAQRMVGDVNVYVNGVFEAGEAEIEIMIAERDARGRGAASEALALMMAYAHDQLGVRTFIAKISAANKPSRRLFQKLGFTPPSDTEEEDDDDDDDDQERASARAEEEDGTLAIEKEEEEEEGDDKDLLGKPNVFGEVELRLSYVKPDKSPIVRIEQVVRDDVDEEEVNQLRKEQVQNE